MESTTTNKRWQDWANLVLGIWLFVSPWVLGFYSNIPRDSWNFFLVGAALVVFAAFALNLRNLWEEWVNLALGVWMAISPWALNYSANAAARDDAVLVGVIVAVLSLWSLSESHFGRARQLTH